MVSSLLSTWMTVTHYWIWPQAAGVRNEDSYFVFFPQFFFFFLKDFGILRPLREDKPPSGYLLCDQQTFLERKVTHLPFPGCVGGRPFVSKWLPSCFCLFRPVVELMWISQGCICMWNPWLLSLLNENVHIWNMPSLTAKKKLKILS